MDTYKVVIAHVTAYKSLVHFEKYALMKTHSAVQMVKLMQ